MKYRLSKHNQGWPISSKKQREETFGGQGPRCVGFHVQPALHLRRIQAARHLSPLLGSYLITKSRGVVCDHGVWLVGVEASTMISSPTRFLLTLGSETTRSWAGHYFCAPTVCHYFCGPTVRHYFWLPLCVRPSVGAFADI